jgi:adenylylsulfate kinase
LTKDALIDRRPDTQCPMATNVVWHNGAVTREDRGRLLNQQGLCVWLTGLSASGKSTIAVALERELHGRGHIAYRLDGDNIRCGLNANLGFSAECRKENIRRIAEVVKLMGDAGVICASAFISPYAVDRQMARDIITKANIPFLEVYVDCPLAVAEQRDPKGLYKRARNGEIKHFTGIDDPYEVPENPEIVIDSSQLSIAESVDKIIAYLEKHDLLLPSMAAGVAISGKNGSSNHATSPVVEKA